MANSGGSYVVHNGKRSLNQCTKPAPRKNAQPEKVVAEPAESVKHKNTEEQAKA